MNRRPFITSAAALQIITGRITLDLAAATFPHCQRDRHDMCPGTVATRSYRCACDCHNWPATDAANRAANVCTDTCCTPKTPMPTDPAYCAAYNIGWTYSQRPTATLDHVDQRYDKDERYDAILDGYLDYAAGRDKWHTPNCIDHDNCSEA